MLTFQELINLAQERYRQAHAALSPFESWELTREGGEYLTQAKEMRHSAHVVEAAWP